MHQERGLRLPLDCLAGLAIFSILSSRDAGGYTHWQNYKWAGQLPRLFPRSFFNWTLIGKTWVALIDSVSSDFLKHLYQIATNPRYWVMILMYNFLLHSRKYMPYPINSSTIHIYHQFPWACIAAATLLKPAILLPANRLGKRPSCPTSCTNSFAVSTPISKHDLMISLNFSSICSALHEVRWLFCAISRPDTRDPPTFAALPFARVVRCRPISR